jgi:transposase-like protein
MGAKRRRIEPALKAKAALAAVRGDRTTGELAGQFGVHPVILKGNSKGVGSL